MIMPFFFFNRITLVSGLEIDCRGQKTSWEATAVTQVRDAGGPGPDASGGEMAALDLFCICFEAELT